MRSPPWVHGDGNALAVNVQGFQAKNATRAGKLPPDWHQNNGRWMLLYEHPKLQHTVALEVYQMDTRLLVRVTEQALPSGETAGDGAEAEATGTGVLVRIKIHSCTAPEKGSMDASIITGLCTLRISIRMHVRMDSKLKGVAEMLQTGSPRLTSTL